MDQGHPKDDKGLEAGTGVALSPGMSVDDGWTLEDEPMVPKVTLTRAATHRDSAHVEELIRSALAILDGVAPEKVALSGDGWSLCEEPVRARATSPQLLGMIHAALEEADSEGWLDDEPPTAAGEAPPSYSIHRKSA